MSTNPQPKTKVRLINPGHGSSVAKARYNLYRHCNAQLKHAMANGFYLEAITLLESMITDRLESRIAALHGQDEIYRAFGTLGELLFGRRSRTKDQRIIGLLSKDLDEPSELVDLYHRINEWRSNRNACLHEMVKLGDESDKEWKYRYAHSKSVAKAGQKLFRDLSRITRAYKRAKTGGLPDAALSPTTSRTTNRQL